MKPGLLFTNVGRRASLLQYFRESLGESFRIVATDNWSVAPALFSADEYYLTPRIDDPKYIGSLITIIEKENIKAITTLIDPDIETLARHRDLFIEEGVLPLLPKAATAQLCFDKYRLYKFCCDSGIPTTLTFNTLEQFESSWKSGEIDFPVFVKPRTGSGSVGAKKVNCFDELRDVFADEKTEYIIQEYMDCDDCDADVYVDCVNNKVVRAFTKRKIETRIGGASKTISFKDAPLFELIDKIASTIGLFGPNDIDFFYRDGVYYLSEINPRFGGAYLHAYGAGVDFPKLIANNILGIENERDIGNYDEGLIMMMYDAAHFVKKENLRGDYRD